MCHVSPKAMIHGVLETRFVPGPRGHFVGGSPVRLHAQQLPLTLTP